MAGSGPSPLSKLNARQRIFVQRVVEGATYTQAALDAGYSAKRAPFTGSRLAKNGKIVAALAQLRTRTAKRADLTIDDIRRMHVACYKQARELDQPSAANKAAESLGKMIGAYVERREHLFPDGPPRVNFAVVLHSDVKPSGGNGQPKPTILVEPKPNGNGNGKLKKNRAARLRGFPGQGDS